MTVLVAKCYWHREREKNSEGKTQNTSTGKNKSYPLGLHTWPKNNELKVECLHTTPQWHCVLPSISRLCILPPACFFSRLPFLKRFHPISHSPPFTFPSLPSFIYFSPWLMLVCVCGKTGEREKERAVESPAKLEQSSPWWYFYPGQQAPPGVYITHTHTYTLPPLSPSSLSLICFCFIRALSVSLSVFSILALSHTHHHWREVGDIRLLVSLQLEALAVCTAACVACYCVELSCFGCCVCMMIEAWNLLAPLCFSDLTAGFIDFLFYFLFIQRQTGWEIQCKDDLTWKKIYINIYAGIIRFAFFCRFAPRTHS